MMNKLVFFGLLILAASITYLAVEIKGVSDSLETVEPHIPRLLEESKAYRMLVPGVVQEVAAVREQTARMIPDILERVDRIEQQIDPILKESAALRLQASEVVDESRAVRETAPDILSGVVNESQNIRQTVPDVLSEVEAVRRELPENLEKIDLLLDKADRIIAEATKNALKRSINGTIDMPGKILKDVLDMPTKAIEKTRKRHQTTNDKP